MKNSNAFQLKADISFANRKSNTYNLAQEDLDIKMTLSLLIA